MLGKFFDSANLMVVFFGSFLVGGSYLFLNFFRMSQTDVNAIILIYITLVFSFIYWGKFLVVNFRNKRFAWFIFLSVQLVDAIFLIYGLRNRIIPFPPPAYTLFSYFLEIGFGGLALLISYLISRKVAN